MEQRIPKLTVDQFKDLVREIVQEVVGQVRPTPSNEPIKDFMNVKEAASFLNLAVNTVYEKTSEKTIPHYKYGNKIMFKRSELIVWIEAGRVSTISDMQIEMLGKNR